MFGSNSCSSTLISPPDIHPSLLQPGTEGFTLRHVKMKTPLKDLLTPASAHGVFFSFFFFFNVIFLTVILRFKKKRQPKLRSCHYQARYIRRNACILCQSFNNTIKTNKKDGRRGLCGKVELPNVIFSKTKKSKHILVTNIYTIFDT